jgi:hypothetical protein
MLISDNYREINRALHENTNYGRGGGGWKKAVVGLMGMYDTKDVLDYGCGKGTLKEKLNSQIKEYDPAIHGKDAPPEPADIVVCTDVLEHIEPGCLYDVLLDLKRVTKKVGFFTIALREARKTLSDGRNAHLIVKDAKWWLNVIREHFKIHHIDTDVSTVDELVLIVSPTGETDHETNTDLHRLRSG